MGRCSETQAASPKSRVNLQEGKVYVTDALNANRNKKMYPAPAPNDNEEILQMPNNNTPFQTITPSVSENGLLRTPQREGYTALCNVGTPAIPISDREVGLVLPVGCGKSGLITLAPFALKSHRTLVIAPNVKIADQLKKDFDPSNPSMFYQKCKVLSGPPYPEAAEIRGTASNLSDLEDAHVVITNIQQIQGEENRWLQKLAQDFFDLIVVDEGHHNVADSWEALRTKFPDAQVVNFTATPTRSDGRIMTGRIIYTYSVFRAIREGYVKHLKAVVLNPRTLKYVRREDDEEVEVDLEEVRRLGEEDSDFRRSIVTSKATLDTIVDASIRELYRIRAESSNQRHKIIAAALNYTHCTQVVEAYRARNLRADYVHSREDCAANDRVLKKLENHELDVIVQVRKLGEGFDHPYLSVAAVLSVFQNLSPFVQFVGRIMRVVDQNNSGSPNNQGSVVFHAGANIARQWTDFQAYSEADQEFFDQLLPMEGLDFSSGDEILVQPFPTTPIENSLRISEQSGVLLEEIPLLYQDEELRRAAELLASRGVTPEQYREFTDLQPIPTTLQRERRAARSGLDQTVQKEVGRILGERKINAQGKNLDQQRRGRTNFVVIKSAVDAKINGLVSHPAGSRSEFSREELSRISSNLTRLVAEVEQEIFNA
jgi:superfamily II DNA or RNA helicase